MTIRHMDIVTKELIMGKFWPTDKDMHLAIDVAQCLNGIIDRIEKDESEPDIMFIKEVPAKRLKICSTSGDKKQADIRSYMRKHK